MVRAILVAVLPIPSGLCRRVPATVRPFRWRLDDSDADPFTEPGRESITIRTRSGMRVQDWYNPSTADRRQAHTAVSSGGRGVKTRH